MGNCPAMEPPEETVCLNPGGTPVVESEIITWANSRLEANGKTECTIKSFQDKSLKDATPILELVDCIKPNSVDWSLVIKGKTLTEEECFENAKYCVSVARKIAPRSTLSLKTFPRSNTRW